MAERLQKVIAHAGIASRRAAEGLITTGRVKVNGETVTTLGTTVNSSDRVEVDGISIEGNEPPVYFALHKPAGYVTTVRDPQGRPTVMRLLPRVTERVYPVGRLDEDSEGLLIMTNDGELAHRLAHPRWQVQKEYMVDLAGEVAADMLDKIRFGIQAGGDLLRAHEARLAASSAAGSRVIVILTEGKKREVRRMFEALGHRVLRLRRVRFGPLELGDLPAGQARPLTPAEVEALRSVTSA